MESRFSFIVSLRLREKGVIPYGRFPTRVRAFCQMAGP